MDRGMVGAVWARYGRCNGLSHMSDGTVDEWSMLQELMSISSRMGPPFNVGGQVDSDLDQDHKATTLTKISKCVSHEKEKNSTCFRRWQSNDDKGIDH